MKYIQKGFVPMLLAVIVASALGAGGYAYYSRDARTSQELGVQEESLEAHASSTDQFESGATSTVGTTQAFGMDPKEDSNPNDPWTVFRSFITYAEVADEAGLRSVLYKPDLLKCEEGPERCAKMYKFISLVSSMVEKSDYVNRWEDSRQIVLSTKAELLGTDASGDRGYERSYLYFAYDDAGTLKYLGQHGESWSTVLQEGQTFEDLDVDLEDMMRDSDYDGLTDNTETCGNGTYNESCVPTDPNSRDSDGDGWWDGTEKQMR